MTHPRTILVSRDDAMKRVASAAVGQARRSSFESIECLDDIADGNDLRDVALFVIHLEAGGELPDLSAFRSCLSRNGCNAAILVVADEYRPATALEAIRLGAVDYLPRPIDQNELRFLVEMQSLRLLRQGKAMTTESAKPTRPAMERLGSDNEFIYMPGSKAEELATQIRRVASLPSTLMLAGETGVGKSRVARLIHELSPRRARPMLTINCGALSPGLFESEMFGHVRGSFTGADNTRVGKFAEAADGTLFLDEIDTLPLGAQAKLLRTVEERLFEPVGSNQSIPMRARLIVASNRDLETEVREGRFRQDLFFRLNVITLEILPLRQRSPEVIRELASGFLSGFFDDPAASLSEEAMNCLTGYHWPGNVRELRNVIERTAGLSAGPVIRRSDLPAWIRDHRPTEHQLGSERAAIEPRLETREENEVRRIVEALALHDNNRLRAAKALGISRMTLYNKLNKYGLDFLAPRRGHAAL